MKGKIPSGAGPPDPAARPERQRSRIRPSGGYRTLRSFQAATLIYDATYWFCEKFIDSRSRTVDQMIQAARSGRQNIAEGSRAAATSSQTELRLVNVARASLEELLLDFEDFLRHRRLGQWAPDSPEAKAVRQVPQVLEKDQSNESDRTDFADLTDQQRWALYARWLDHDDSAVRANAVICLIHQANYLLDLQIEALERQFVVGGGYSEQLAAARLVERDRQRRGQSKPVGLTNRTPDCPQCGKPMVLRTAKSGRNAGSQFWGCSAYPDCRGACPLDGNAGKEEA
jgi:four helix bundle suffix protein